MQLGHRAALHPSWHWAGFGCTEQPGPSAAADLEAVAHPLPIPVHQLLSWQSSSSYPIPATGNSTLLLVSYLSVSSTALHSTVEFGLWRKRGAAGSKGAPRRACDGREVCL